MPLSNAERQRRYRERQKNARAGSAGLLLVYRSALDEWSAEGLEQIEYDAGFDLRENDGKRAAEYAEAREIHLRNVEALRLIEEEAIKRLFYGYFDNYELDEARRRARRKRKAKGST